VLQKFVGVHHDGVLVAADDKFSFVALRSCQRSFLFWHPSTWPIESLTSVVEDLSQDSHEPLYGADFDDYETRMAFPALLRGPLWDCFKALTDPSLPQDLATFRFAHVPDLPGSLQWNSIDIGRIRGTVQSNRRYLVSLSHSYTSMSCGEGNVWHVDQIREIYEGRSPLILEAVDALQNFGCISGGEPFFRDIRTGLAFANKSDFAEATDCVEVRHYSRPLSELADEYD
jgi:hypothetical protein